MMDNIAVVLRGHIRTWFYNYPQVFKFYESIAKNVDYYVVTWEGSCDSNRLELSFNGKNLKKLIRMKSIPNVNSWIGPALQSFNIAPYVRYNHRKTPYNALFDTRPDIIYRLNGKTPLEPESNCLYTTSYTMHIRDYDSTVREYYIGMTDVFLMTTPDVYSLIAERFVREDPKECHSELKLACDYNNVNTGLIDWVDDEITRPNCYEDIPNCFDYFNSGMYTNSASDIRHKWGTMSSVEKISYLDRYNIAHIDYMTDNPYCKI